MTLEDILDHVDPATGLVPLQIDRPFAPYVKGAVAGFPATIALSHLNEGVATLFKATKGAVRDYKATQVVPVDPSIPPGHVPGAPLSSPYDRRPEVTPRAQTAPSGYGGPGAEPPAAAIPVGWESWPAAEKRKLAANLSLRRYQELSEATAVEIIQAEQDRRADEQAPAVPLAPPAPATAVDPAAPGGQGNGQQGSNGGAGGEGNETAS